MQDTDTCIGNLELQYAFYYLIQNDTLSVYIFYIAVTLNKPYITKIMNMRVHVRVHVY